MIPIYAMITQTEVEPFLAGHARFGFCNQKYGGCLSMGVLDLLKGSTYDCLGLPNDSLQRTMKA